MKTPPRKPKKLVKPFWERQYKEQAHMFLAFKVFLELDPLQGPRTTLRVQQEIQRLSSDGKGDSRPATQLATIRQWRKRWRWDVRVLAWDSHINKIREASLVSIAKNNAAKWASRRDELREREWEAGNLMLDFGLGFLSNKNSDVAEDKWDFELVMKLICAATEQRRRAFEYDFGATTNNENDQPSEREYLSFREYITVAFPSYQWYWYAEKLVAVLQRVADGEIKRLIVCMPPRHGKSELISRLFASYHVYRYPEKYVGIISYSAELAEDLSRAARDYYMDMGGELRRDSNAVRRWYTSSGGGVVAAGAGGPITGRGFHLGIIDDPTKNAEEASSAKFQQRNINWYASTYYTRLEPNAATIVVQTRWDEADLTGYLIGAEAEKQEDGTWIVSESAENWHAVILEALSVEDKQGYHNLPPNMTLESDIRMEGEALCPERYDKPYLEALKARNPYYFAALYQAKPSPAEGHLIKRDTIGIVSEVPAGRLRYIRYWDKAATSQGGAYTAGVLMCHNLDNDNFYIVDVRRGQWAIPVRDAMILETAKYDRKNYGKVSTWGEQEPGASGKDVGISFKKLLNDYKPVNVETPTGSKLVRAIPFISIAGAHRLYIIEASWNKALLDEMASFPTGKYKDQVDAVSGCFNKLQSRKKPAKVGMNERYRVIF